MHTNDAKKALKYLNSRTWNSQKERDQEKLSEVADNLLEGHRGQEILENENNFLEIPYDFSGADFDVFVVDDLPGIEGLELIEYQENEE